MTATTLLQEKKETIAEWEIIGLELSKMQKRKLKSLLESNNFNPYQIRITIDERCAICINKKNRTITFWKLSGIMPSYSEYIYEIFDTELQDPERPNLQSRIQDLTGFRAPIIIDIDNHVVHFMRF